LTAVLVGAVTGAALVAAATGRHRGRGVIVMSVDVGKRAKGKELNCGDGEE
jgi:hypothetical protein